MMTESRQYHLRSNRYGYEKHTCLLCLKIRTSLNAENKVSENFPVYEDFMPDLKKELDDLHKNVKKLKRKKRSSSNSSSSSSSSEKSMGKEKNTKNIKRKRKINIRKRLVVFFYLLVLLHLPVSTCKMYLGWNEQLNWLHIYLTRKTYIRAAMGLVCCCVRIGFVLQCSYFLKKFWLGLFYCLFLPRRIYRDGELVWPPPPAALAEKRAHSWH